MEGRRGALPFEYRIAADDEFVFTVDIWAYLDKRDPEQHLGWWRFELPPGNRRGSRSTSTRSTWRRSRSGSTA